jgi:hypothetical protein
MKRPSAVLVLAILCLLRGVAGTCCGTVVVTQPFLDLMLTHTTGGAQAGLKLESNLDLGQDWTGPTAWGLGWVDTLLSVFLIFLGVGLLRMRPWARRAGRAIGPLLVLLTLASSSITLCQWVALDPVEDSPMPELDAVFRMAQSITLVQEVTNLLWLGLGVALWIVLGRPSIMAAFQSDPGTGVV